MPAKIMQPYNYENIQFFTVIELQNKAVRKGCFKSVRGQIQIPQNGNLGGRFSYK